MSESRWKIADVIDLEILAAEADFRPRAIAPAGATRRAAFRPVLEAWRRERFSAEVSPGVELASAGRWLVAGLAVLGLLAARATVWGFFEAGQSAVRPEPVNVVPLFLTAIALPFLLTLYGFWAALGVGRGARLPQLPAFLRGSLAGQIQAFARRSLRRGAERLPAERRLDGEAALGALRQRFQARSGAVAAALLAGVQTFGLAFALGLVVSLAFEQTFRSSVFGWQTTAAAVTPERLHGIVQAVAAPWGGLAPTEAQIAATRFMRFRDPAGFPPEAAYAWADFLVWAALVYGLAPRLALALFGWARLRAALARERFDEVRFDPLWLRVSGGRASFTLPGEDAVGDDVSPASVARPFAKGSGDCQLVCPAEIFSPEFGATLGEWLRAHRGWEVASPVVLLPAEELSAVAGERVTLVQEAFMPPIGETLDLVRSLRVVAGGDATILVLLRGKPSAESPLGRPASATEVAVWQRKLRGLGDPRLDVAPLVEPC